jgi:hypothetical protein
MCGKGAGVFKKNKSLLQIVEQAVRQCLEGRKKFRLKLTPYTAAGRLMPGADLQDRDSLYDIMDELR